ncbi:hypothetical protein GCM10023347_33780 [Streptomyces chumphonensis]|uniref:Uncharacterized protein n=1 Tax=Streptomyces chumphonensis TaxID=1214925 RepID=A0A927ICD5_9ACTN|nr:hypothetical protein [Streptomyces chumphonensis]MBD3931952.1 hypothetical protein [Streptomyces chumphonensis]
MTVPDETAARMNDAIEYARWQDLADALNALTEWGADPLLGLADQLGVNSISILDPAETHQTYRLRYRSPYSTERDADHLNGWIVEQRPAQKTKDTTR